MNPVLGRTGLAVLALALCPGSLTGQSAELELVEELRLGRTEGSGPDIFANIDDLAIDADGRIFVVDVGWKDVRLFDRDGRFVRRLAREGDGPGERRYGHEGVPTRITWDAHRSRLWIDDGLHLSVLDSLGIEYARDTRDVGWSRGNGRPLGVVFRVDARARLYEGMQGPPSDVDTTYVYVARGTPNSEYAFVPDQVLQIEARAQIKSPVQTRETAGGSLTFTSISHEPPQTVWTVSPSGEMWGVGINEPRLWQLSFTGGETVRSISLTDAMAGSTRAELRISPEGWFWMRRGAESEGRTTWDLLDNCGAYQGSASVPHNVSRTKVGSGGRIHVVASDALGIEYILRFRLEANVQARPC